jgi:DNA polymerase I
MVLYKTVFTENEIEKGAQGMSYNEFIYGSSKLENVVGCEVHDDSLELFIQSLDGSITTRVTPYRNWVLSSTRPDESWLPLKGLQHFRYLKLCRNRFELRNFKNNNETWKPYDLKESAMIMSGFTYFKGLRLKDVSVLAFDIEATTLEHNNNSKVLLISNTFRCGERLIRKLFSYEDYSNQGEMLQAWSEWVVEINPSIILGHNIYGYDLPYMAYCASRCDVKLTIGRGRQPIYFDTYPSKFRKDGSQFYHYHNVQVYGREVIDTMFLSIKYDQASRKYESYGLKNIIKQEGLEREGRQFYDASKIAQNYTKPSEWAKIKEYAEHDADDALALWDLMGSSYFYLNRSIPKSFQSIINGATGSQLNSFLIRTYLSVGHSIPAPSEAESFEGAISIGNPGVYKNVYKVDVASLYPSIMLQYSIYDREKDTLRNFQKTVQFFTAERLENKTKAKSTGERYYKDVEQAQKIVINSLYGLLGAPGLHFNSPKQGSEVTRYGREILTKAINWAETNGFKLVNADTDSIAFCDNHAPITNDDRIPLLKSINELYTTGIRWEDDGLYDSVLVLKAKNYVLKSDGKTKIKGSALKATLKERALKEFIIRMTNYLLEQNGKEIELYHEYVLEILNPLDISRWCSKKTITDKILSPRRENEAKVMRALSGSSYVEGDKVYMYFTNTDELKLVERFENDHDIPRLLEKLHKTIQVFDTVLDIKLFQNYSLKKNQKLLEQSKRLTTV